MEVWGLLQCSAKRGRKLIYIYAGQPHAYRVEGLYRCKGGFVVV